jgi:hypothetical protein
MDRPDDGGTKHDQSSGPKRVLCRGFLESLRSVHRRILDRFGVSGCRSCFIRERALTGVSLAGVPDVHVLFDVAISEEVGALSGAEGAV